MRRSRRSAGSEPFPPGYVMLASRAGPLPSRIAKRPFAPTVPEASTDGAAPATRGVVVIVIGTPATGRRPESTSWPRIVTGRPNFTRTRPPLRTFARSRCDVTLVTRKRAGAPRQLVAGVVAHGDDDVDRARVAAVERGAQLAARGRSSGAAGTARRRCCARRSGPRRSRRRSRATRTMSVRRAAGGGRTPARVPSIATFASAICAFPAASVTRQPDRVLAVGQAAGERAARGRSRSSTAPGR